MFCVVLLFNLDIFDIFIDFIKVDFYLVIIVFVFLVFLFNYYFVIKVVQNGIVFEFFKVVKVFNENGLGMKYMVGDRMMMDLGKLKVRRKSGDDKLQWFV